MKTSALAKEQIPSRRRLKRRIVRLRTWTGLIPSILVGIYLLIMLGLTHVADGWIVALAATPLFFAIFLASACFLAYRRDFYA